MALSPIQPNMESLFGDTLSSDSPFLSLARLTSDAVLVADNAGLVSMINPQAEALIGLAATAVVGLPLRSVLEIATSPNSKVVGGPADNQAGLVQHSTGDAIEVQIQAHDLSQAPGNRAGWKLYVLRAADSAESQASDDAVAVLTGATSLESAINRAIADCERGKADCALLWIKIDQLDALNRHADLAESEVASDSLAAALREYPHRPASLARIDDGTFVLLAAQHELDAAEAAMRAVRQTFDSRSSSGALTLSAGVVSINRHSIDAGTMLNEAETACRLAFENGGNQNFVAGPDSSGIRRRREELSWVASLSKALDDDAIELTLQRIEALAGTNKYPPHYEVQIVVRDDAGAELPLDRVLAAAERALLRSAVDRWVIANVLDRARLGTLASNAVLTISLSEASLSDPAMLAFIRRRVVESGAAPEQLVFRVVEPDAVKHAVHAARLLSGVRTLGCKVALEDVGGGRSSFAYLASLPADYIVFDQTLTQGAVDNRTSRAMIEAVQRFASVLGLRTIAKGVTTQETADLLRTAGVDFACGLLVDAPKPFTRSN
jgi:EAL domain-containing protein (putative c-di-GMP-specific phosphodiesterase class I)/GGDEF domain-containing protein